MSASFDNGGMEERNPRPDSSRDPPISFRYLKGK